MNAAQRREFDKLAKAYKAHLTAQEAAHFLGVTRQTVVRRIKAGQLRAGQTGRFWRISPDSLRAMLQLRQEDA